jgi:hypothetical protein
MFSVYARPLLKHDSHARGVASCRFATPPPSSCSHDFKSARHPEPLQGRRISLRLPSKESNGITSLRRTVTAPVGAGCVHASARLRVRYCRRPASYGCATPHPPQNNVRPKTPAASRRAIRPLARSKPCDARRSDRRGQSLSRPADATRVAPPEKIPAYTPRESSARSAETYPPACSPRG